MLLGFSHLNAQHNDVPVDSIYMLRELSRDESKYTLEQCLIFAQRSLKLAKQTKIDSTILWSNMRLSGVYFSLGRHDLYVSINQSIFKTAERINDKKAIAHSSSNLGGYYHYFKPKDSAYIYLIKALKYNQYADAKYKHHPHLIIADIYIELKLYLKCEEHIVRGLSFLNELPETLERLDAKFDLYNLLGMVCDDQEYHEKALKYYKKAIEVSKKMIRKGYEEGELNLIIAYNNIAEVYRNKKNYKEALGYYDKMHKKKQFFKYDPCLYPFLIDNIAMTNYLNGDTNVDAIVTDLKKAYRICDTLPENYEKAETKQYIALDIAEVYSKEHQKDSAYIYAKEAYELSKILKDNDYKLKSLMLLANLEEGDKGKAYLKEYITLSDSLTKVERNMRNKFARIEYDSDQLEIDNVQLAKEKKWLYTITLGLLGLSLLLYIILVQRSKNRKLKFSKAQQKANEDIYNLILAQQYKLEEGRLQERYRVSEELHDGVLSKLFGTRLGLSFLELEGDTEDLKKFNDYLEQINTIEKDVRQLSHNLKTNDLTVDNDFSSILKALLNEQKELHHIEYNLTNVSLIDWKTVSDKIKVNLYRIIQETLFNTIKHAQAKIVNLVFSSTNNSLELVISDDGKGFNPRKVKYGIGLKNIKSRIKALKGTVFIDSGLGKGTTIKVSFPL